MQQISYSIIIPHKNTPDLLLRLLDSIPRRDDVEIIVVDDNSDADQKAKTDRYDVRIIYLGSTQSKGGGRARNIGMDEAKGKWLLFADADDYYKQGFLEVLDEYKEDDIEILFFNIESVDSNTLLPDDKHRASVINSLIQSYDGSNQRRDELLYLSWSVWHRMVRRDFILRTGCRFEEISKGNDVLFTFENAYFLNTFKVEKRPLYVLTYSPNSITYRKMTFNSLFTGVKNRYRRFRFFEYIGHSEWGISNVRMKKVAVFDVRVILSYIYHGRISVMGGIHSLVYYFFNMHQIKRQSYYYINVINKLKRNQLKKIQ